MKYLRILFIFILLQSCTFIGTGTFPRGLDANYFLRDNFPENKKAIIIVSIPAGGSSLWYRIDDTFNGNESNHSLWLSRAMNQVIMIEPGIYSMGLFYTVENSYNSSYIKSKGSIWSNDKPAFASFEAKSGEVLYIGDLNMSGSSTTRRDFININPFNNSAPASTSMGLQNNYENAKKSIKDKYPKLSDKLSARLIKLGGSNE